MNFGESFQERLRGGCVHGVSTISGHSSEVDNPACIVPGTERSTVDIYVEGMHESE